MKRSLSSVALAASALLLAGPPASPVPACASGDVEALEIVVDSEASGLDHRNSPTGKGTDETPDTPIAVTVQSAADITRLLSDLAGLPGIPERDSYDVLLHLLSVNATSTPAGVDAQLAAISGAAPSHLLRAHAVGVRALLAIRGGATPESQRSALQGLLDGAMERRAPREFSVGSLYFWMALVSVESQSEGFEDLKVSHRRLFRSLDPSLAETFYYSCALRLSGAVRKSYVYNPDSHSSDAYYADEPYFMMQKGYANLSREDILAYCFYFERPSSAVSRWAARAVLDDPGSPNELRARAGMLNITGNNLLAFKDCLGGGPHPIIDEAFEAASSTEGVSARTTLAMGNLLRRAGYGTQAQTLYALAMSRLDFELVDCSSRNARLAVLSQVMKEVEEACTPEVAAAVQLRAQQVATAAEPGTWSEVALEESSQGRRLLESVP